MRIALIRREFITNLDGINRFIVTLAEGLKLLGHDPIIITWSYRGIEGTTINEWLKMMHGVDLDVAIYSLRGPENHDIWFTMFLDWYLKGGKLLRSLGTDIALVNGVIPLRFSPKVFVAHGPSLFGARGIKRLMRKLLYRMYDKIICISKHSEEDIRGLAKCHKFIPLPLKLKNYKALKLNERENFVVHIGTRAVKNPHISIEVARRLRKRGLGVKLMIIGDVIFKERVKNLDFVEVLTNVSEKEKNDLLSRARALILPSSAEALSYVVLEAMASGTPPVVSTAVPKEVVMNGYSGFRINTYNVIEYVNTLEKLLTDDELWLKIHTNAINFVRRYDYINIAKKYIELFKECLESLSRAD